jgi:hypothetical protein
LGVGHKVGSSETGPGRLRPALVLDISARARTIRRNGRRRNRQPHVRGRFASLERSRYLAPDIALKIVGDADAKAASAEAAGTLTTGSK